MSVHQISEKQPSLSDAARKWLAARGLDPELCENLGMTSGRLPSDPDGSEWLKIPYERDGVLVNYKLRALDAKRFQQKAKGEAVLWRVDCLADEALASAPLVITEGEMDAVAAIQAGFWRTVSLPMGAPEKSDPENGKYEALKAAAEAIEPVREIIIAADEDVAGKAMQQDLVAILKPARCRIAHYPVGCKDLNDVLLKHGEDGVRSVLENAPWSAVPGMYDLDELPPLEKLTIWRPSFLQSVGDLIPLCPGHISIWTGIAGHGKSTLLNACIWSVASSYGLRVAHGAFETTPQREYLEDCIAHLSGRAIGDQFEPASAEDIRVGREWVQNHITFINADGYGKGDLLIDATVEWFLGVAQSAVVRKGCRIIVLDPWSQLDHEMARGEREDQYIRRALKLFKNFARTFDVHFAVVAHPMKPKRGENGMYDMPEGYEISGASHWFNFADVGVTIHRDPEMIEVDGEEQPDPRSRRVLIRVWKVKNHRMMNPTGDAYAVVDPKTGRYLPWTDRAPSQRQRWSGYE